MKKGQAAAQLFSMIRCLQFGWKFQMSNAFSTLEQETQEQFRPFTWEKSPSLKKEIF